LSNSLQHRRGLTFGRTSGYAFDEERRTSETNWARRQKRHDQLMRRITGFWGDVSGVIGTLPAPKQLQLPAGEEGGKAA